MRKNKLIIFSSLASITAITAPMISASCNKSKSYVVKVASYGDQMKKILDKSIELGGAWGDANAVYNNKADADKIAVIGVTGIISNDGIQVRSDMKQIDIDGLCWLFQKTIKASKTDSDLKLNINGKLKSVFQIYNHDAYSKLSPTSKITYNVDKQKDAYNGITPAAGSEYFEVSGADYVKKTGSKVLNIQFIPSNDPTNVTAATAKLKAYFTKIGFDNINIDTATSYNSAATQLSVKSIDVAFLPADTWGTHSGNSLFVLQAGRKVQIIDPYKSVTKTSEPALTATANEKDLIDAINGYKTFDSVNTDDELYISSDATKRPTAVGNGYTAALKAAVDAIPTGTVLPPVGYYRSYIYARKDSKIYKVVTKALADQGANWKLKWDDVKDFVTYGYTSTSSSASYIYPEQWFIKHFEGFKSFN